MTATEQEIAEFLINQGFMPPPNPYGRRYAPIYTTSLGWRYAQAPTEDELAQEFLGIAEFRALQLGTWLGTTEGEIITRAVEAVVPVYLRPDIELLVAGLKLAARLQQQEGQRVARGVAVAVLVGVGFIGLMSVATRKA